LLASNDIAFHFKHLLITNLGFVKEILLVERKLLTKIILPNRTYTKVFLESVSIYDWFELVIEQDIFNKLLNPNIKFYADKKVDVRTCSIVLGKFLAVDCSAVVEFAQKSLTETEAKLEVITELLISLKDWNNPIAFQLFETYISEENLDDLWYCKIVENAFHFNISWF
jgi:hypothetical protein